MMKPGRRTRWVLGLAAWLLVCAPVALRAQRTLHWDALDVDARLDAAGVLHVTETQTMVFTGDWNGGERIFNLRPRQRLSSVSIERIDPATGTRRALTPDSRLDDVDEFSLKDGRTLRWRSRLPADKPFSSDRLTYAITYELSGILRKEDDIYRLDHDFAFPDRPGAIERFSLRLALDPAWQPIAVVDDRYTAGPLPPGRSFVLNVPLHYSGAQSPVASDTRRPPEIAAAVGVIVLFTVLAIAAFFVRESRLGRFEPVAQPPADAAWVTQNILSLPAEVVGAAWDGAVGTAEVVALIARMVAEGTLSSETAADGSLVLELKADRAALQSHERSLADALFFGGRTVTSTADVKAHYKKTGFDPAKTIAPQLEARVNEVLPRGADPRPSWRVSLLLFLGAAGLLAYDVFAGGIEMPIPFVLLFVAVFVALLGQVPGRLFRQRIDWGLRAAVFCLIPVVLVAAATGAFLWFLAGPDGLDLSPPTAAAIAVLAAWVVHTSLNALKSRQNRAAIAFRKKLAAGRLYFKSQLREERPALQDGWYPWVLAYGLGDQADRWSSHYASASGATSGWPSAPTTTTPDAGWTGAGGGRSGGAGGGATWAAAAAGMAAGVSAPSSGSGSGSGGGSSGGGSSGGGGGGGW